MIPSSNFIEERKIIIRALINATTHGTTCAQGFYKSPKSIEIMYKITGQKC